MQRILASQVMGLPILYHSLGRRLFKFLSAERALPVLKSEQS